MKVPILSMMWSNTLLIILFLDILILLFIIHKEMDRLSLQGFWNHTNQTI
jgi:hypothetical protein